MEALNAQVFLNLRGSLDTTTIMDIRIDLDGVPVTDYKIDKMVLAGPVSDDFNFIITQIQPGSHTIRMLLSTQEGSFTAAAGQIIITVQAENLQGGTGSGIPRIDILDSVPMPKRLATTDSVTITLEAAQPQV